MTSPQLRGAFLGHSFIAWSPNNILKIIILITKNLDTEVYNFIDPIREFEPDVIFIQSGENDIVSEENENINS